MSKQTVYVQAKYPYPCKYSVQ